MVGMRMPSCVAASSTVAPASTLTSRPSIVRVIMLYDLDRLVLACLPAHIAARAERIIHRVLLVGTRGDSAGGTSLCAQRASDAIALHAIVDQRGATARGA